MKSWLLVSGNVALIALAGAAGTLCRYGLNELMVRVAGPRFPWSTVIANLAGCLLFGIVWGLNEHRLTISPSTRLILLTGFMGAFTTFSTLAFDTHMLMQQERWLTAILNLTAQNGLGIFCVWLGIFLVR